MIPNLSGLRRREPLWHRRGRQRRLRWPLLRRHRRPARPQIPNLSALKNHFGAAAAGSDDFGGLFSADQLALEFPTWSHVREPSPPSIPFSLHRLLIRLRPYFVSRWEFDGFQKATKEMVNDKKGTTTLSFIFDKASSSPPAPGPAWAGTHDIIFIFFSVYYVIHLSIHVP
ncbi:unnamed protein product [Triticum turgidum subsp. durum]|uniref:Uncharacterized protein n=1 Tax=Triticum turgidum subsp. durum TaxID=4567 RepID=A0A9R0X0Z3_TRITD|nr:unnamed protein product [Triticum turgidum subsp. durum]